MEMLSALENLHMKCQKLSFSEGVCLPLKLQSIVISTKKTAPPVTEWGLQYLTALFDLRIVKGDDIFNTLMKESLLPISLVHLRICDLSEMKSFDGNGLRHLSSLQSLCFLFCQQLETLPENCLPSSLKSLEFYDCKKLESLPEDSLPESLKELYIDGCPLLEERYKRKEHWSKIAHIPVISINYKEIKGLAMWMIICSLDELKKTASLIFYEELKTQRHPLIATRFNLLRPKASQVISTGSGRTMKSKKNSKHLKKTAPEVQSVSEVMTSSEAEGHQKQSFSSEAISSPEATFNPFTQTEDPK
ncbi:FNIP repeat protein [Medicago truncatula]|uniref:FNIP repeat protein n=1 Tax=Medicago truncatula TaxID=3880 RepID=G7IWY0_MEDTR|nr:FNIP repeat protein [Medicago truncatula]